MKKQTLLYFFGLTLFLNGTYGQASTRFGIGSFTKMTSSMITIIVPVSHFSAISPTVFSSIRTSSTKFEPWKNLPMDAVVRDCRYDETFKILFGEEGYEERAISFLNAVFAPKASDDRIKKIKYIDGTLSSAIDRTIHFDVKIEASCQTFKGDRFIVEMQKAKIPGHTNRWVYYGARELVSTSERNYQNALSKSVEKRQADHKFHYRHLSPVRVVTLLDFDTPDTEKEMKNANDILIHWDICERQSKVTASNLLSWTFIMLPRFAATVNNKKPKFTNPLDRWLYLLTRDDQEKVHVTKDMIGNDYAIAQGFHRVSHLKPHEQKSLEAGRDAYASRASREHEKFDEGKIEGIMQGKIEILLDDGLTNERILQKLQPKHPSLTVEQIETIRRGQTQ